MVADAAKLDSRNGTRASFNPGITPEMYKIVYNGRVFGRAGAGSRPVEPGAISTALFESREISAGSVDPRKRAL